MAFWLIHMLRNAVLNPVPHDLIQPTAAGIREQREMLKMTNNFDETPTEQRSFKNFIRHNTFLTN